MRLSSLLLLYACAALLGLGGCSREAIGSSSLSVLGPGVVNNPANKSLRFDILKFGLDRFCFEMTRRGAPLKLTDDQPVLGRFFADGCQTQVLDHESRQSFVVKYSGKGYGWTNVTGRIGFSATGLVEYAADFQLHEGAMYVYFRPRNIDASGFQTLMVESAFAKTGIAMAGVNTDELGRQIVEGQLKRGFTVIRYDDRGETDFGMGIIPVGSRPFKPFTITGSDKVMLANDRTEIHPGQQDFVGGFEVEGDDQALYLTMSLDGTAAVDVFTVAKSVGDMMIDRYAKNPGEAALPAPPLLDEPLQSGQLWKRYVRLPRGLYYVIIDHSAGVGRTPPAAHAAAAKVDYAVQLGEGP